MPWCEQCSKYLTPSSMRDDGTCPSCGRPVEGAEPAGERPGPSTDGQDESAPWHFKLLVVALVVYLGWRFIEIFV